MEHSLDPKTIGVFNLEYRGGNGIVGYIGCRIPTALLPKTPLPDFEAISRRYLKVAWDKMTRHELFEDVKTTVAKWLGSEEFDLTLTEEPGFNSPLFAKPMTLEYIGIPKPKPNFFRDAFLVEYDEQMAEVNPSPFIGQIVHFQVEGESHPFPAIIVAIKQDAKVDLNVFHNYQSFGQSHVIIERDAPYDPSGVSGSWRFIPSR